MDLKLKSTIIMKFMFLTFKKEFRFYNNFHDIKKSVVSYLFLFVKKNSEMNIILD